MLLFSPRIFYRLNLQIYRHTRIKKRRALLTAAYLMSAAKKRRIGDEGRTFQKQWTDKYFFIASAEKTLCLICKKSIPVMKDYNLKRHFEKITHLTNSYLEKRGRKN